MIFNSNSTSLGSTVAMAEGYDCSIGTALALIESARNDNAMFNAMLGIEAKALQLENAGYVAESSEVVALQEAAMGGILKKIGELFKKLASKIKTIFHTFFSKIDSLFMSDKQMVKKYEKELVRKNSELNLDKMEVKWRKVKNQIPDSISEAVSDKYKSADWHEEKSDREKNMYKALGYSFVDEDDVTTSFTEHYLDDAEKMELKETGETIRSIIAALSSDMPKKINKLKASADKLIRNIEKEAKECNKRAEEYAGHGQKDPNFDTAMSNLNHSYDMAVVYQDCQLKINNCIISLHKTVYQQTKAAFMKAISTNKKLESVLLADAIAEAAADEVTEVMDKALSDEEISDINAASTNVKDADVSDDPDKLTYGPDQYTDNADYKVDGSVDTDINSKSEAAFFGTMLY